MKTSNQALIDLLGSSDTYLMADLFTFTLITGDVYHWTTADLDITYLGNVYKSGGSLIKRGNIKNTVGIEVDTLSVTLYPSPTDTISNIKMSTAILSLGFLDNAKLELRKCFMTDWTAPIGDLILFMGTVSDIQGTGTQIDISVKSKLEVLNAQVPRNLYQASCLNTVYDSICQAEKKIISSKVYADGTKHNFWADLPYPRDHFNLGVVTFTSGLNVGVKRAVKNFINFEFTFSVPLPYALSVGDTFDVYLGCNGTMDSCNTKFSNILHFRGMPFIPVPETSI